MSGLASARPVWTQVGLSDAVRVGVPVTVHRWGDALTIARGSGGALTAESADRGTAYPTCEAGGIAFVFPRPAAATPPPPLDEFLTTELADDRQLASFTTIRVIADLDEIQENSADTAHLSYVHRTSMVRARPFEAHVDDRGHFLADGSIQTKVGGSMHLDVRCFDPYTSLSVSRGRWSVSDVLIFAAQVTDGESELIFVVRTARVPVLGALLHRVTVNKTRAIFDEDRAIWAEKVWLDQPILSDADGPIRAFRRWLRAWDEAHGMPLTSLAREAQP